MLLFYALTVLDSVLYSAFRNPRSALRWANLFMNDVSNLSQITQLAIEDATPNPPAFYQKCKFSTTPLGAFP